MYYLGPATRPRPPSSFLSSSNHCTPPMMLRCLAACYSCFSQQAEESQSDPQSMEKQAQQSHWSLKPSSFYATSDTSSFARPSRLSPSHQGRIVDRRVEVQRSTYAPVETTELPSLYSKSPHSSQEALDEASSSVEELSAIIHINRQARRKKLDQRKRHRSQEYDRGVVWRRGKEPLNTRLLVKTRSPLNSTGKKTRSSWSPPCSPLSSSSSFRRSKLYNREILYPHFEKPIRNASVVDMLHYRSQIDPSKPTKIKKRRYQQWTPPPISPSRTYAIKVKREQQRHLATKQEVGEDDNQALRIAVSSEEQQEMLQDDMPVYDSPLCHPTRHKKKYSVPPQALFMGPCSEGL